LMLSVQVFLRSDGAMQKNCENTTWTNETALQVGLSGAQPNIFYLFLILRYRNIRCWVSFLNPTYKVLKKEEGIMFNCIVKNMLILVFFVFMIGCSSSDEGVYGRIYFFGDGERIFFGAMHNQVSNLYNYNLKTKELTKLTDNTDPEYYYSSPSLSPDESAIAFSSPTLKDYTTSIHTMDINGNNIAQITQQKYLDSTPLFSPDGNSIFFLRAKKLRHTSTGGKTWIDWDIYIMNRDGSGVHKITDGNFSAIYGFSVSPTDEEIIFTADLGRKEFGLEQYKYNKYYPSLTFLVKRENPKPLKPFTTAFLEYGGSSSVSFSHDGKDIVFIARTTEAYDYDVLTMNCKTKKIAKITNNGSFNESAVFSPDKKSIFFLSDKERNRKHKLFQINIDGTGLREIKIFND